MNPNITEGNVTFQDFANQAPEGDCSSAPCSPPNLFETVVDEIRSKHSIVEEMMLDRDPHQKVAMDDFNCYLFNNVLFLIDQFEARVDQARKIATAYRDDEYFDEGDMVRLPWESPANSQDQALR
jgi:hypothetical protein